MLLKVLYIVAIGLLFAAFVGFGINTFYKSPKFPECDRYPVKPLNLESPASTPADDGAAKECEKKQSDFMTAQKEYSRNLSLILISAAVLVIVISLFGLGTVEVIGDGITLGGVFLLFAGLTTAFTTDSEIFRFAAVTAGLVVILLLSWWKFVRQAAHPTTPIL